MSSDDLVVVGRLGRPHGIAGDIRVRPTGPTLATLVAGDAVTAQGPAGRRPLELRTVRSLGDGLVIGFAGIETREKVAPLVNHTLAVAPDRLVTLAAPDEFYVRDLMGCAVLVGDRLLGTVSDVIEGTANDALIVTAPDGAEATLVPFTHDAITAIDMTERMLRVRTDLFGGGDA
jgi:16S rRNA processing protein RimM